MGVFVPGPHYVASVPRTTIQCLYKPMDILYQVPLAVRGRVWLCDGQAGMLCKNTI